MSARRLSGLIRLTSGDFRGRAIKAPGGAVHPMGARERLSLLNSVSALLLDATVLDVYAGSGALGLEMLSRRAAHATFVEKSPAVAKVLQDNIRILGVERQCDLIIAPVEKLPRILTPEKKNLSGTSSPISFDLIVADPPYTDYHPEAIAPLENLLRLNGLLVLSHPKGSPVPAFTRLTLKSFHLHAGCRLSIFGHQS